MSQMHIKCDLKQRGEKKRMFYHKVQGWAMKWEESKGRLVSL
jgi:hypothetical protein